MDINILNTYISKHPSTTTLNLSFSNYNFKYDMPNGCEILLLNFEDDTFTPVTKQSTKIMNIVQKLYDECGITVDFEPTGYFAPHHTASIDIFLGDKIFHDLNVKLKLDFVENYLPLVLTNYAILQKMKENKFYPQPIYGLNENIIVSYKNILEKLKINIPEKFLQCYPTNNVIDLQTIHCQSKESQKSDVKIPISYNSFYNNNSDMNNHSEPTPYNLSYNALYPDLWSNYLNIENFKNNTYTNMKTIYVFLNYKFFYTRVFVNPDIIYRRIAEEYTEYGFSKLFELRTDNDEIIKCVQEKFEHISFDNIDDINRKLQILVHQINLIEELFVTQEKIYEDEKQIKQFFEIYYEINDNIEDKMKATYLYDMLENSLLINIKKDSITSFRNTLSKYLTMIGLKKKRFDDGFYYYGIRCKLSPNPNQNM